MIKFWRCNHDSDMNKFIKDLIAKFIQKDFIMNFSEKVEASVKILKNIKMLKRKSRILLEQNRYKILFDDLSKMDWQGQQGRILLMIDVTKL